MTTIDECEAVHCMYNDNNKCKLSFVQLDRNWECKSFDMGK